MCQPRRLRRRTYDVGNAGVCIARRASCHHGWAHPEKIGVMRFPTILVNENPAGVDPLYAAGVDPIDIQRRGRCKSAIYMRYIWHDNLRLRHLRFALTAPTKLKEHLQVDLEMSRRVDFQNEFRAGSASKSNGELRPRALRKYDFFSPQEAGRISESGT